MQIVRELAGYSMGAADSMRRVMSKKKLEQMETERRKFIYGLDDEDGNVIVEGCIRRGIDEKTAVSIFDEMNDFANYAFNKSHAAAYAVIAYQTAYLKTLYPAEFMAALISSIEDADKINEYIVNCMEMGIKRLPPDINKSREGFTVEGSGIRFGLAAVKNVGRGLVQRIVAERERGGDYTGFSNFVDRLAGGDMNKRAVEGLIMCGAFDSLGVRRSQLIQMFERIMDSAAHERRSNIDGQVSLFDDDEAGTEDIQYPDIPEFDKRTLLSMEKETIGMYFSGHPMEEYAEKTAKLSRTTVAQIMQSVERDEEGNYISSGGKLTDGSSVAVCGIVTGRKNKTTKSRSQMAFIKLEDVYGSIEVIVFPKTLPAVTRVLEENSVVLVKGRLSLREDEEPKVICETAQLLDDIAVKSDKTLYIKIADKTSENLNRVRRILTAHQGKITVCLYFADTKERLAAPESMWTDGSEETLRQLEEAFGAGAVILK